MTAEEWDNASRNSWITNIGRRNPPITNGYSTTPPQYNPYWSQQAIPYRRADYTQPIQNVMPPINQALNENFQPRDTNTFTNYNGQPVLIPSNAPSQLGDFAAQTVSDAWDWGKQQALQKAMTLGIGATAVAAPILSTRVALSVSPGAQRVISALASTRLGRPAVNALRNAAKNPYVQKVDRLIGKIGDWFY